jgi:hypothetical protein
VKYGVVYRVHKLNLNTRYAINLLKKPVTLSLEDQSIDPRSACYFTGKSLEKINRLIQVLPFSLVKVVRGLLDRLLNPIPLNSSGDSWWTDWVLFISVFL